MKRARGLGGGGDAGALWSGASGEPLDAALASSCALPGVFPPITIDGRWALASWSDA